MSTKHNVLHQASTMQVFDPTSGSWDQNCLYRTKAQSEHVISIYN